MAELTEPDNLAPTPSAQKWILAAIVLIAFALRLGFVMSRPVDPLALAASLPDQGEYLELAEHLLAGQGLVLWDARFGQHVLAYRSPGYPLFVALLGANVRVVFVAQALIDASCAIAVWCLGRRVLVRTGAGGEIVFRGGAFAAVLVSVNPFLIYFSGTILSETPFTALLIWGMAYLIGVGGKRGGWGLLFGSILLALAVLVRPSALWLPPLLGIVAAIGMRRSILAGLLVPIVFIALVLFPWAYRNHQLLDRWIWTTTNGGITLYDGFNPAADGSSNQDFIRTEPGLLEALRLMSETERNDSLSKRAWEYIKAHPERLASLTARKLARLWSPVPMSNQFGASRLNVIAGCCYAIPLFGLTVWGLVTGKMSKSEKTFLLLPAIYFTLVHAASVGSLRYRIPADVPMSVGAVAGSQWLLGSKRKNASIPAGQSSSLSDSYPTGH